jgi:ribonucleoside-triphosphate reductase
MKMASIKKRDGRVETFNRQKIVNAVKKTFIAVDGTLTKAGVKKARKIAKDIEARVESASELYSVEQIQDMVEEELMSMKRKDIAKAYILYREKRNLARGNTTDKEVFELLGGTSEYWNEENSNKNSKIVTTQRDYLAGILSTDITRRVLLPQDIVKAHDAGIIHFHDADYFGQNALHNCELINLNDMLQNGTVINGVMIDKPHKFLTACTIATQIILGVSSSSYGGATISLTHLAPFVRDSYNYYYNKYLKAGVGSEYYPTEEAAKDLAEYDVKKEIEAGVQTFNYQVNSMTNTNGQAPFLSVCMYLGETEEYKKELAMIIEEFLKQRILGFKNEKGVYVTPAFPKLLYVLEEDNIHEDSPYYYLTKLAAECTAKRMVPDYISEKIMKENKINQYGTGDAYPCMGCRSFL